MKKYQLEELMLTLDETFHYVKDQSNNYLAQAIYLQMLTVTRKISELEEDERIDWFPNSNNEECKIPPFPFSIDDNVNVEPNKVLCPFCGYEQNKIIATLKAVGCNDVDSSVNEVLVNEEYRIPVEASNGYQSENNHHILISCDNGHLYIESYEEREGVVFKNKNMVMIELALYLNAAYHNSYDLDRSLDAELLQHIKDFFCIRKQNLY